MWSTSLSLREHICKYVGGTWPETFVEINQTEPKQQSEKLKGKPRARSYMLETHSNCLLHMDKVRICWMDHKEGH